MYGKSEPHGLFGSPHLLQVQSFTHACPSLQHMLLRQALQVVLPVKVPQPWLPLLEEVLHEEPLVALDEEPLVALDEEPLVALDEELLTVLDDEPPIAPPVSAV